MVRLTLASAAVLLSALLAAGCGAAAKDSTSDFKGEARQVAVTIEDYQDASRSRNEEKICNDLLAPDLVHTIEAQEKGGKGSCPARLKDRLRDVDSTEITVKKVNVSGTTATAVIQSEGRGNDKRTDTLTLVKNGTPRRWRIATIGG